MKTFKDAKVGQKVQYQGCSAIGKCEGIITKILPLLPDDCPEWIGWAVLKVDDLPHQWPYSGNSFAPSMDELEVIDNAPKRS